MKKTLFSLLALAAALTMQAADRVESVTSPDGNLKAEINLGSELKFSVYDGNTVLVKDARIGMTVKDGPKVGVNPVVKKKSVATINEQIAAPFYREPVVENHCNELTLKLADDFSVIFRAYNSGIAYRFASAKKGDLIIESELAEYNFPENYEAWIPYVNEFGYGPYAMSFENVYQHIKLSEATQVAFTPLAVDCKTAKVSFMESDLEHYPGIFLRASDSKLTAEFAQYPKAHKFVDGRKKLVITEREDYIAKVNGTRTFPWRIMVVTHKDTEMPVNNLVYALGAPNRIGDVNWIKPGKLTWDWWNGLTLTGVDFRPGINTQTYKYYIDFAAKHGVEYIALDEGWYYPRKNTKDDNEVVDILHTVKDIDLPELVRYGKEKKVGIVLWLGFNVLSEQLEAACKLYSEMGIKGFKVDFLDRNDQTAVEQVYHIAETCAKYHLFLDLHGMYPPTGYNRTFPNIVNVEGVRGLENAKWGSNKDDFPTYDVTFPYLRMMPGYVDYTPGGMRNATYNHFVGDYYYPQTQGTRCHQMAMYVVFDSPLSMMADSPTAYEKEEECASFIASIPNQYEKTKILSGEIGKYIVTARKVAGKHWWIAGLNNWDARDVEIDISELFEPGDRDTYFITTIYQDGNMADRVATDYKVIEGKQVGKTDKIKIHMAKGGGFVIKLFRIVT
ncbi:MAG: glycoside hydrolase family 97 protein [Prevotellaceae bacterium]|nr:glycoside hydrolase family 97 protein [Prevotellaceae bacterium]